MNKFLLSAVLMVSVLAGACGSSNQTSPQPQKPVVVTAAPVVDASAPPPIAEEAVPVDPVPEPESLNFTIAGAELTLPESGWNRLSPPAAPDFVVLVNGEKKNRIMFSATDTDKKLPLEVLAETKHAREVGFKVVSSKSVKNNGTTFTLVVLQQKVSDRTIDIQSWLTIKGSTLYVFRCGGVKEAANQNAICTSIFNTIKIN